VVGDRRFSEPASPPLVAPMYSPVNYYAIVPVGLTSLTLSCSARARVSKPRGARPATFAPRQRRERMSGGVPPTILDVHEALQPRTEAGRWQLQRGVGRRGMIRDMPEASRVLPGSLKYFISHFRWPNSVMYHYTSRLGLENIVKTKRMWASDLRSMNDPEELLYSRALIDRQIAAMLLRVSDSRLNRWLEGVQQKFHRHISDASSSFSISFSEHPDLSHQWRDYAAGGTGFVLGWSIDSDYPEVPLKTWVAYERAQQEKLVDDMLQLHLTYTNMAAKFSQLLTESSEGAAALSLAMYLDVMLQTFKRDKWSAESEFRYVYQFFDGHLPAGIEIKHRPTESGSRRYIEADFSTAELRRVLVGPSHNGATTIPWLRRLLDSAGYRQTEIFASEAVL
jgi:hypothetical protein